MNVRNVILQVYREERSRPFDWDGACCLQWCGLVAERLTGRDPVAHYRARYNSEMTAKREMVKDGYANIGDVAASVLPEIPVAMAKAGDWVLCIDETGLEGFGVVSGAMAIVKSEAGLGQLPMTFAKRAFRVT